MSILLKHVISFTDPTPTELIALFLYQKDAAVAAAREIKADPLNLGEPSRKKAFVRIIQ